VTKARPASNPSRDGIGRPGRTASVAKDPDPRIERTRARVLAATADLLLEHGFDHVTIDDIATRSGVARSTIYRNWPQRPRLFLDALRSLIKDADPVDTAELRTALRAALAVLVDALSPTTALGRLLPSLLSAADRDPELAELHRDATRHRVEILAGILDRGVATGDLPPDTDTTAAATFLAATLYYRRLITGEPVSAGVAATLIDQILAAPPRRPR
jgi:AcrR family transcriptional regulator